MKWNISNISTSKKHETFKIERDGEDISNLTFLELLRDSHKFREFYHTYLRTIGFDAFFWENKPMMSSNLNEPYEVNVIESNALAQAHPDTTTFSRYFSMGESVVSFPNLGNDAKLIAPCPVKSNKGYAHIGDFVREAPDRQMHEFWQKTGEEMLNAVTDKRRWLSTSGLGVYWLHIRIDTYPKYYQTKAYRNG